MSDHRLDKVGEFVMMHLRDRGIEFAEQLIAGRWKAPALADLQASVRRLSRNDQKLVYDVVVESIDVAIHDFLFALGEWSDTDDGVSLHCSGVSVARSSDGLQGEPFGENGWIARFSRFPPSGSTR